MRFLKMIPLVYGSCVVLIFAIIISPSNCVDPKRVSKLVPPARVLSAMPENGDYAGVCEDPLQEMWVMPQTFIHILSPGYPEKNFAYDYFCGWTFVALNGLPLDLNCTTVTLGGDDFLHFYDNNQTESIYGVNGANLTRTFKGSTVSLWLDTIYKGHERTVDCNIWSYNPVPFPPEALLPEPEIRTTIAPSDVCRCGMTLDSRIVGGSPARADRHKWMVTLGLGFATHFCAGTLVSDSWIVTAAHCLKKSRFYQPEKGDKLSLGLGFYSLFSPLPTSISRTAREVVIHPLHNETTNENDIALLRVDPLDWGDHLTIGPACLPYNSSELYEGKTGILIGWGALSVGGERSKVLMEVSLPIISNSDCEAQLVNTTLNNALCASTVGERSSCRGDSGGPLVVMEGPNAVLVGVVSGGYQCGLAHRPAVFTRVAEFLPWIAETTLGTEFCPRA